MSETVVSAVDVPPLRALLANIVSGALVLGLGSRVVMRVIAILAGPEHEGASTGGGNIVGQITVKGSIGMLVPGAVGGVIAGLMYLVIRQWLPGGLIFRGLSYGVLTLVLFGSFLLGDGRDFRFTAPGVQLVMFGALFLIYGLFASWWAERWGKGLPSQRPTRVGYLVLSAIMVGGLARLAGPAMDVLRSYRG
jgi:hypothetical protein